MNTLVFEDFILVPAARTLTRGGTHVRLGGRAFDLLVALAERAGEVVTKDELTERVWPRTFVEDSNLRVHIAALRKTLGDTRTGDRFIANVPGRGYQFVARLLSPSAEQGFTARADTGGHAGPSTAGRLIGRDQIVASISADLARRRLVTISGVGGIGKTAVALAVLASLQGAYRDGARFVDFAPLGDPLLAVAHVTSVLRVRTSDAHPLGAVVEHLKSQSRLLVFDNCEHVLDQVSVLVEEILKAAPEIHILVTSREPLRAAGEWVHHLAPLAVPTPSATLTLAEVLTFPSARLLLDRVQAADAAFAVKDEDAPVIADLCVHLDGLPLAIELAAVRVPLLGLHGLANRLDDRFLC